MADEAVRVVIADPDQKRRETLLGIVEKAADTLQLAVGIDQASDGTTALALVAESRPRLLLSEVLLDGVSGLALLRRIQADQGGTTAVVFVTTMARETDRYWGLRNGAHAYFTRPYDEHALGERIKRILAEGAAAPVEKPAL